MAEYLLAVDPGREKTGLALVEAAAGQVRPVLLQVLPTTQLAAGLARLEAALPPEQELTALLLGDGTNHQAVGAVLQAQWPRLPLHLVAEGHSSEEARRLYYQLNPPQGWRRLVPRGLLLPAGPLDAYAALVLARRYLQGGQEGS